MSRSSGSLFSQGGYFYSTRTPAYGLIMIVPLLLFYEVMALRVGRVGMIRVRNLGDVLLKEVILRIGIHGSFALGIFFVSILILAIFLRKREAVPLRLHYFFIMILESAFYAVFLGLFINRLMNFVMLSVLSGNSTQIQVMLAFGAGVYEELLFRAFFFYVSAVTLIRFMRMKKWAAWFVAAFFSSILFSWAHYLGAETFTYYSFFFRFFIGLAFCGIFLTRGLGVAAWTHAFYDLFIIVDKLLH